MGLKWRAPDDDGGLLISQYVIEKRDTSMKAWLSVKETDKVPIPILLEQVGFLINATRIAENTYTTGLVGNGFGFDHQT